MPTASYNVNSYDQFEKLVSRFSSQWGEKQLILLTGPLGIGKSEWVRLSLRVMGYNQEVPSPTFVLHQIYSWNGYKVDHIDLYRIRKEEELESFGFFELFLQKKGIIFVEWADKLSSSAWPTDWDCTRLDFKWENSKRMLYIS